MADISKVKRAPVFVDIGDGIQRQLKYTLSSFARMETKYGSVDKAMDAMQAGSIKAVIFMIWAGIAHSDKDLTEEMVGDLIEMSELGEITTKMNAVMDLDLPDKTESPNE